jgi:dihydroflavonol-4-reductase
MQVLLTGATGFVGAHVARALARDGHSVRCLARVTSRRGAMPAAVSWVEGDVRSSADLRAAVDGCEAVVHTAALYALWAPDRRAFHETNVEGTRRVLEAAKRAGARRVVYTSSVACVGEAPAGGLANEETAVDARDLIGDYKRSKWEAEQVALGFARDGLEVVVVNPASVIGPGDDRPTPTGTIIRDYLLGRLPRYLDTPMSFVDVRDVAVGHALALRDGKSGRRYILTNYSGNLGLGAFLALVAEEAGLPPPRGALPYPVAWVAGAVSTFVADHVTRRPPRVPLSGVRMARHRMQFDPRRAIEELGLPQTPLRETVRAAVAWFRRSLVPPTAPMSYAARVAAARPAREAG